ncbi:MAG: hypothetical protein JWM99_2460, partial [Verrucomicrobiales bacterium]|nr:hypothetical protein [Verrucomicrobiales bacterium]
IGCKIYDLKNHEGIVSFTRKDERLPLNLSPLWMLHGMYIPIGTELNRYMLTIDHLQTCDYEITANGRALGTWSSSSLAAGVNIASATPDPWMPGGPWDAQAHIVKILTDMRDEIVFARQGMDQTLSSHPRIDSLGTEADAIEKSIVNLQRNTARPIPIKFIVSPKTK